MSTPPTPPRGTVKVWGNAAHPKWSVTVSDGATAEHLADLVEQAVTAFRLVSERLAAPAEDTERTRDLQ